MTNLFGINSALNFQNKCEKYVKQTKKIINNVIIINQHNIKKQVVFSQKGYVTFAALNFYFAGLGAKTSFLICNGLTYESL